MQSVWQFAAIRASAVGALCLWATVTVAAAPADQPVVNAKDVKWTAAPPILPPGAKIAVLYGNPAAEGPFVMRLLVPGGYKIPLHLHSKDQSMTVISGALYVGDTWEPKYAREVKPGGFVMQAAKKAKFLFTKKSPTTVEIHGVGPFDVSYLNPEDDPQKWAEAKRYYFPSQYEESARKAAPAGEMPTF